MFSTKVVLFSFLLYQYALAQQTDDDDGTEIKVGASDIREHLHNDNKATIDKPSVWENADMNEATQKFQLVEAGFVQPFEQFQPIQEVTVIHHIPVKIPIYANILLPHVGKKDDNAGTCMAPNGRGLKYLLEQIRNVLPLEKLRKLTLNALQHDHEVQALQQLLTSSDFNAKVKAVTQTRDFSILKDYICKVLYLDLKDYVKFAESFMNLTAASDPSNPAATAEFQGRAGIRGLLADLRDLMPQRKLTDLYQQQLDSDEYVMSAVQHLNSSEFLQLLGNLLDLEETKELLKMLKQAGVPIFEVKELLEVAVGMYGDELGSADEDLMP